MGIGVTAMKVAVAATGSTFKGSWIRSSISGSRHELTTPIKGKTTKGSSMVFKAFFVGHRRLEWRWARICCVVMVGRIERAIRER